MDGFIVPPAPRSPYFAGTTDLAFASAWWRVFRNQHVHLPSVLLASRTRDDAEELRRTLLVIAPSASYPGHPSPNKLTRWLNRFAGRSFDVPEKDGFIPAAFVFQGDKPYDRLWQLRPLASESEVAETPPAANPLPDLEPPPEPAPVPVPVPRGRGRPVERLPYTPPYPEDLDDELSALL